jgi:phosphatidylglycerophosphate synthase
MLGKYREKTKPFLNKISKVLSILPISPNTFTFLAIPLSFIAAYFLYNSNFLLGSLFIIWAILIDFLDGSFAAAKKQKSLFGNYFDAIVDKVVEAIIYLGLSFHYPLLAFICFSTTMLVSYAKPRVALVIETDNHDWPAIGERSDRLILLILGLISLSFIQNIDPLQIILVIIAVVNTIGFIQRVIYAKKLIKKAIREDKILPYLKR